MLTEALIKLSLESLQCEQNPPTFTTKYYCTHLVPVPNIRSFPLNVSDLMQNLHQKFKRETRQESGSTRTRSGSTTWERISTTGESDSTNREGTSKIQVFCIRNILKTKQTSARKHTEHSLMHLIKTTCEIWSVSDKVQFWVKDLPPFSHRSLQFKSMSLKQKQTA